MLAIFRLLSLLPLRFLHAIGAVTGRIALASSSRYRAKIQFNLAIAERALGSSIPEKRVAAESGKAALELPIMWSSPAGKILGLVREVEGWEIVDAARAQGKGVIFLTPHLGCFEITAQYIASKVPIAVLFRPATQGWMDSLMRHGRSRPNMTAWPADLSGVRALVKALRRGETVGLLPDQAPRAGEGMWAPFFGRPAYTMTLAARLSEGAAELVFVWAERLPRGSGYRLRFSGPASPIVGDLAQRTIQINAEIERLIGACPEQYLWGYNRFKQPQGVPPPP